MDLPTTPWFGFEFDGSCNPNPGPMGIGYTIGAYGSLPLIRVGAKVGEGTNNIAEYHALIAGLRHAIRFGLWALNISSDSQLLVNQISGKYKVRDKFLQKLHGESKQLLEILAGYNMKHIRREENATADELSRNPAWIEPPLPPTPTSRNGKPLLLHNWQAAYIKHWWLRGLRNSYFMGRIFGVSPSLIEHIGNYEGYRDADFSEMPEWSRVIIPKEPTNVVCACSGAD